MEYDWEFSRKSRCSDKEKRQCMKLVYDLVDLAIMARRNGLLSLLQHAEESPSFLLRKGLQLVIDGVNPQVARNVMESYILSGNYTGKKLLSRCIILEGVTAIQKGLHPKVTKEFLLSFLGEDSVKNYEKEFEDGSKDSLDAFLKKIEDTAASSATGSRLDHIILKLDNEAIEKFLMEIDTGELAKAIKNMGGQAQLRIFNNLPQKAAYALRDTLEDLDLLEESEVAEAQQMALEIISDLEEQGAITVSDDRSTPG